MKKEIEIKNTHLEKDLIEPEHLPETPTPAIEIPDITPVVKTEEITDDKQQDKTA
jgi:hypothetical protein